MSNRSINLVTSSLTIDPNYDTFLIDASGGNVTVIMNDILGDGHNFVFKRIDTSGNTVTLQGYDSSQTIDGSVSINLSPAQTFMIISFGSVWYTVL